MEGYCIFGFKFSGFKLFIYYVLYFFADSLFAETLNNLFHVCSQLLVEHFCDGFLKTMLYNSKFLLSRFWVFFIQVVSSVTSVAQPCPTLCNPMNRSMPGMGETLWVREPYFGLPWHLLPIAVF